MKKTNQELLNLYFQSRASDAEVAELEKRMLADSDLRELYLQEAILETNLNSIAPVSYTHLTLPTIYSV